MTDCLIIGFNDFDFKSYVNMVAAMGRDSGAYRDLNLAFIDLDGEPARALDVLTRYYFADREGQAGPADRADPIQPFHNMDFLWPTISYLATFLSRRGLSFDFINLFQAEKDRLRDKLQTGRVLSVAITTTLYVIPDPIIEIVTFVRQCNPQVKIIVGGPYIRNHTTSAHLDSSGTMSQLFQYLGADFYVDSSEGEFALSQILQALKNGGDFNTIENIAYKDGPDYVITAKSVESNPLADNQVDYSLLPKEALGQFVSLRTAKSCPFACAFCGFPQRAGTYTYLPVELVEKELNALNDLGTVTTLTFLDDTFNVPKRRFKDLLRMMIRNRYDFHWNAFYRCDHGDAETIELMQAAGCEGVFLGVESGSATILEHMNKTARQTDYLTAIPLLRQAGISSYASLIIGYPGETPETVRETIDFLEAAQPDFFRAQLWYADHMTPIWQQRENWQIEGEGFNWRHRSMDSATASDMVEKMFLGVQHSIWMPQAGFEQWSTFYLQRRGMTMEQMKHFLSCFNDVIKEKLLFPDQANPNPQLLDRLRRSCQFDRPQAADPIELQPFPAADYIAAEQFWTQTFRQPCPPSPLATLADGPKTEPAGWAQQTFTIDKAALQPIQAASRTDPGLLLLAAFSCVLSRLSGQTDMVLRVRMDQQSAVARDVPLRAQLDWEHSFTDCVQRLAAQLEQANTHSLYALPIVTNPLRMQAAGAARPSLDLRYAFRRSVSQASPERVADVKLNFCISDTPPSLECSLGYARSCLSQATSRGIVTCCQKLVQELSQHPDRPIGELVLSEAQSHQPRAVDTAFEGESFNFET